MGLIIIFLQLYYGYFLEESIYTLALIVLRITKSATCGSPSTFMPRSKIRYLGHDPGRSGITADQDSLLSPCFQDLGEVQYW